MCNVEGRTGLCHQFCSLYHWTSFLEAPRGLRCSSLRITGFHCFLQIMSCWLLQAGIFSMHWGRLHCEAAATRIATSNSQAMVLSQKKGACSLQIRGEALPQDQSSNCCDAIIESVCHAKERAEPKGEALHLPFKYMFPPSPLVMNFESQTLSRDQKDTMTDTGAKISAPHHPAEAPLETRWEALAPWRSSR